MAKVWISIFHSPIFSPFTFTKGTPHSLLLPSSPSPHFYVTHTLQLLASSSSSSSSSPSHKSQQRKVGMDVSALEAERLTLDSLARERMAQVAAAQLQTPPSSSSSSSSLADDSKAWKWVIRKRVWDLLETESIAREPRPVHHRIPNFKDADAAAAKVASLPEFRNATVVKVNPDSPQRQVRYLVLRGGKRLVTPQPRLRTGFFSVLEPHTLNPKLHQEASTMAGVTKYGKPIGLNARFKVDFLVVGSVAVDPTTGARLGKGEGFAELEYGILRHMGAIDDSTLIVTSVHDKQLVNDIPVEKLLVHDVPVDVVITPTQIIRTNTSIPKPKGIYWDKLSPQKLSQIKVLQELKKQIEMETGKEILLGPDEPLPPLPERKAFKPFAENLGMRNAGLVIWSFDELVTSEELHAHLDKLGIAAIKIDVFPETGPAPAMARVYLPGGEDVNKLVALVDKTEIRGRNIRCQVDKGSTQYMRGKYR